MRRIELVVSGESTLDDGLKVGDPVTVKANGRVIGIEEDLIDVTPAGDTEPRFASGGLTFKVLLYGPDVLGR